MLAISVFPRCSVKARIFLCIRHHAEAPLQGLLCGFFYSNFWDVPNFTLEAAVYPLDAVLKLAYVFPLHSHFSIICSTDYTMYFLRLRVVRSQSSCSGRKQQRGYSGAGTFQLFVMRSLRNIWQAGIRAMTYPTFIVDDAEQKRCKLPWVLSHGMISAAGLSPDPH